MYAGKLLAMYACIIILLTMQTDCPLNKSFHSLHFFLYGVAKTDDGRSLKMEMSKSRLSRAQWVVYF